MSYNLLRKQMASIYIPAQIPYILMTAKKVKSTILSCCSALRSRLHCRTLFTHGEVRLMHHTHSLPLASVCLSFPASKPAQAPFRPTVGRHRGPAPPYCTGPLRAALIALTRPALGPEWSASFSSQECGLWMGFLQGLAASVLLPQKDSLNPKDISLIRASQQ